MITLDDLKAIMPLAPDYVDPLNAAMSEFQIDNPRREAAFLAQIAHESGQLRWLREFASGDAYEGRKDLGNTEPGDGRRFKGRGLIQITGRANYRACGDALGLDLITSPELLEEKENACRSAAWFWQKHGLNDLADKDDFLHITRRINGGTTGWDERMAFWNKAKEVLGVV